jgi:hypothetical protein
VKPCTIPETPKPTPAGRKGLSAVRILGLDVFKKAFGLELTACLGEHAFEPGLPSKLTTISPSLMAPPRFLVIIVAFIVAVPSACSLMRAASLTMLLIVDGAKPSSRAMEVMVWPPSCLWIIFIFVSKSINDIRQMNVFHRPLLMELTKNNKAQWKNSTKMFMGSYHLQMQRLTRVN